MCNQRIEVRLVNRNGRVREPDTQPLDPFQHPHSQMRLGRSNFDAYSSGIRSCTSRITFAPSSLGRLH